MFIRRSCSLRGVSMLSHKALSLIWIVISISLIWTQQFWLSLIVGANQQVKPAMKRTTNGNHSGGNHSSLGPVSVEARNFSEPVQFGSSSPSSSTQSMKQSIPIQLNSHPPIQPSAARKKTNTASATTGPHALKPNPVQNFSQNSAQVDSEPSDDQGWVPVNQKRTNGGQASASGGSKNSSGAQNVNSRGRSQQRREEKNNGKSQLPVDAPVKSRKSTNGSTNGASNDVSSFFGGVASTRQQPTSLPDVST